MRCWLKEKSRCEDTLVGHKHIDPAEAEHLMLAAGVRPLEPYTNSKFPWPCECLTCGRRVNPQYSNVKNGTAGCKYCAGRKVDENTAVEFMLVAGAKPLEPFQGAKEKWKCQCLKCGRNIEPIYSVIKQGHAPCPYCSLRLLTIDPVATMIQAGANPLEAYKSVHTRWKSECLTCHRTVFPTLQKVRRGQKPCGFCAHRRMDVDEAKATMEEAGLEPLVEYPGAGKPWLCKCLVCGNKPAPTYNAVSAGGGCAYCSGRAVNPEEALRVMLVHGVEPIGKYPGATLPWTSKCKTCDRIIHPTYGNIRNTKNACVYCSGRKVDPDYADSVAKSKELRPLEPYPGSTIPWLIECLKCNWRGYTTWTRINMKRDGAGCPNCTTSGFKPALPSYYYVIENLEKSALKVGISNELSGRLRNHKSNGWIVRALLKFENGSDAYALEQLMLKWLRQDLQLPPAFQRGDGWTETVPLTSISETKILEQAKTLTSANYETVALGSLNARD
jgi:DNA-directed RNA polymerase subunit RPC12/RpoP